MERKSAKHERKRDLDKRNVPRFLDIRRREK